MKIKDIVRLLVLNESQNDAEGLINLFRNSGYPTRAHRIVSESDLEQRLTEDPWDLMLCDGRFEELSIEQALAIFRDRGDDIPTIVLLDNPTSEAFEAALDRGAQDAVDATNQHHLFHAALREIANRRERLEKNALKGRLDEVNARYELLMEGSRDAIAYVTGGMHIDVNEAYCEHFGYDDTDELASMPLVDLIAPADQEKFKSFLKEYTSAGATTRTLDIAGERSDGGAVEMTLEFSPATYEGEECTQIIIRRGGNQAAGSSGTEVLHAILDTISATRRERTHSAVALVRPTNLDDVRRAIGYFTTNQALGLLAEQLRDELANAAVFALGNGDFIALFNDNEPQAACDAVTEACDNIATQLLEVDSLSAQFECRAGVIGIDDTAPDNAGLVIDHAYQGLMELLDSANQERALVYTPPATPVSLDSSDIDLDQLAEQGRLTLLFQPIVSLRGDSGEYYEVVTRLLDSDDSEVDAARLAPGLVDEKGQSTFDRWVIFSATKQLARQRGSGADTRLIINITPTALKDRELVAWLGVATKAAGLPPESVTLQLRESDVSSFVKLASEFFGGVREIGCRTAIAEFGASGEPVRLLKHVQVDFLKIHPELAQNAQLNEDARQALKQLVGELGTGASTAIVPEVDSAATLATLWQIGAGYIQGSYLAEPGEAMDYEFAEIA